MNKAGLKVVVMSLFALLGSVVLYQSCDQGGELKMTKNPASLGERSYYLIEQGYTCLSPATNTQVQSYKARITLFSGSQVVHLSGDGCDDTVTQAAYDPAQFVLSADQNTLTYQGETYVYYKSPPF